MMILKDIDEIKKLILKNIRSFKFYTTKINFVIKRDFLYNNIFLKIES